MSLPLSDNVTVWETDILHKKKVDYPLPSANNSFGGAGCVKNFRPGAIDNSSPNLLTAPVAEQILDLNFISIRFHQVDFLWQVHFPIYCTVVAKSFVSSLWGGYGKRPQNV